MPLVPGETAGAEALNASSDARTALEQIKALTERVDFLEQVITATIDPGLLGMITRARAGK